VIPVEMAEAVFAAAKKKGKLLIVENAGHNDVVLVGGDRYWAWVRAALLGDVDQTAPAPESAATMNLSGRDRGTTQPGPSPTR
jgi:fructose-specific component phosphotransferase system IIB-like protein